MNTIRSNMPVAEEVVAKALINTKKELDLSNEVVSNIIRVYRSLYAILGGSQEAMRHWLTTQNKHLRGTPIVQLQEMVGLVNTVQYLDAMRGRA